MPCRCWRSPSRAGCVARESMQGEPVGHRTVSVAGHPTRRPGSWRVSLSETARYRMRSAEPHRDPELSRLGRDVRPQFARRGHHGGSQEVGHHRDEGPGIVSPTHDVVEDGAPRMRPLAPGSWMTTPKTSSNPGTPAVGSRSTSSIPTAAALVSRTARLWANRSESTRRRLPGTRLARRESNIASATAVASSSMDAPATGSPLRSATIVWKLSSASRRPWEISGW